MVLELMGYERPAVPVCFLFFALLLWWVLVVGLAVCFLLQTSDLTLGVACFTLFDERLDVDAALLSVDGVGWTVALTSHYSAVVGVLIVVVVDD